jgi:uracil-DNA glycosylase
LALLRPALIFLVGGLAIERLLGKVKLSEVVGRTWPMNFGREDPFTSLLVPLPHPSGASTWLNDSTHQQQLAQGLKAARDAILAKALAPLSPHGSQPGAMDGLPYDV